MEKEGDTGPIAVPFQKPPSAEPEPSVGAEIWHGDASLALKRGRRGGVGRSPANFPV